MNRRASLVGAVALAAGIAVGCCAAPASAAAYPTVGPVSGTGWNTQTVTIDGTDYRVNALPHNTEFYITYGDTASMNTLKPYALVSARALNAIPSVVAAGIHFNCYSTVEKLTEPAGAVYPEASPAKFHINLTLRKGSGSGMSWTNTSVLNNRFAWGGDIWIDPEYFNVPNWFTTNKALNTVIIHNTVSHEIGHAIGLNHPAAFKVPAGRAVPVMTPGPSGGYQSTVHQGLYTAYDTTGINNLVANGAL
jgi:hypothetical protein